MNKVVNNDLNYDGELRMKLNSVGAITNVTSIYVYLRFRDILKNVDP